MVRSRSTRGLGACGAERRERKCKGPSAAGSPARPQGSRDEGRPGHEGKPKEIEGGWEGRKEDSDGASVSVCGVVPDVCVVYVDVWSGYVGV